MSRRAPAPVHVVNVCADNDPQDVYNLTVADAHEFIANGVLVSNCDALRYGVSGLERPATSAIGLGYYAAHAGR